MDQEISKPKKKFVKKKCLLEEEPSLIHELKSKQEVQEEQEEPNESLQET